VNARSALFDVYGDHLLARGGAAPVAALVELMGALDITAPAVRTAVSRMVTQGWLSPTRLAAGPGYRLTPKAQTRLAEASSRIYRRHDVTWDRSWHLVSLERVADRSRRERLRSALTYLGYAVLRDGIWVSPHRSTEVTALLDAEGVSAEQFSATYDADDATLAAGCWDLGALAVAYTEWLEQARALIRVVPATPTDRAAYVARSRLVHEWRKFLFTDPALPHELLPNPWPGDTAATFFGTEADRLMPAAGRYVESCLRQT
jgi:phenylacetic acid degradation operon negative regulatory protein